ncbi:MAG: AAA family ATPase, partial [Alphaproteobacteria bacterium]|nr:AAA family ATPase [Alphaproteobacteria bacterium]
MLNRIEAKNFKAFKRLDYKCAKLNLLTGLNGAGKSSFVQLMLLLRATANKIGNCQAEIDLR